MTNEEGRSRTARRASALPSAAIALAAASLAIACGSSVSAPARSASTAGTGADAPAGGVFALSRLLRAADASFEPFALVADARLRAVAPSGDGILVWSHDDDTLRRYRTDGSVSASWPLEAAAAWASPSLVLTRDELYTREAGFGFALHAVDATQAPRKLGAWTLDCFPSDLSFDEGGVLLAGADRADATHSVRRLGEDGTARTLFEFPKRDDFARLVADADRLLVFASARTREARELAAYLVGGSAAPAPAETRLELLGLPESALCWYGSGFFFEERWWLPLALADGDTALAGFRLAGDALELEALVRGSLGVYAPLGPSADGASFRYLAYDHEREPGVWRLASFDGETLAFDILAAP
ncbi:MAG: hypothetical protein JXA15_00125 [Spirochaetales bacterium]|nr:hypothetical protein [Spirochaetales bacterium]